MARKIPRAEGKVPEPLHEFRQKMLFVKGLYNEQALKGNIHGSQKGNFLSGAPLAIGGEIRLGGQNERAPVEVR